MILLLGEERDPICEAVRAGLRSRGEDCIQASILFGAPSSFRWTLGPLESTWELQLPDGRTLREQDLQGVLVRRSPWLGAEGWSERDRAYAFTEAAAAALGWLWSLRCPVVGRLRSSLWYRASFHLLDWVVPLRSAGLVAQTARITNDPGEARAFAPAAAVLHLLGPDAAYRVATPAEWEALRAYLDQAPALLTRPHGPVSIACVANDEVLWSEHAHPRLESRILGFARSLELDFVEVAFAADPATDEPVVVAVEPVPTLERFDRDGSGRIVARLCDRLAGRALVEVAR